MPIASLDGARVPGIAAGADDAVGPAFGFEEVNRGLFVGKFFEEFEGAEVAFVVVVDGGSVVGHVAFLGLVLLW